MHRREKERERALDELHHIAKDDKSFAPLSMSIEKPASS